MIGLGCSNHEYESYRTFVANDEAEVKKSEGIKHRGEKTANTRCMGTNVCRFNEKTCPFNAKAFKKAYKNERSSYWILKGSSSISLFCFLKFVQILNLS